MSGSFPAGCRGSIAAAAIAARGSGSGIHNGCSYCLSAHTYLAENVAKLSPEEVSAARSFTSADGKSRALLGFAEAVVQGRGQVSDESFAEAREAGVSDVELGDVVGHVALNVLTNYFNTAFQVAVDFPLVEPLDEALAA